MSKKHQLKYLRTEPTKSITDLDIEELGTFQF